MMPLKLMAIACWLSLLYFLVPIPIFSLSVEFLEWVFVLFLISTAIFSLSAMESKRGRQPATFMYGILCLAYIVWRVDSSFPFFQESIVWLFSGDLIRLWTGIYRATGLLFFLDLLFNLLLPFLIFAPFFEKNFRIRHRKTDD